jgi:hypothetical protein
MSNTVTVQNQNNGSFTQTKVIQSRSFDYAYDKNYILSNQVNHVQDSLKAKAGTSNLKLMPVYETMFTELKHQPRFTIQMKNAKLPAQVSQDWHGKQNYQREKLILQRLYVKIIV